MRTPPLVLANRIAFGLPLVLVGGALASQYLGGLYPCEMCHWQRWPHYAAILVAAVAFPAPVPLRRALVFVAAILIAVSGAIGVFHAGVEYGWWQGITACTSMIKSTGSTADMLNQIMNTPLIRCDVAQWTVFGVSLAGFNAVLSFGGALVIASLAAKRASR